MRPATVGLGALRRPLTRVRSLKLKLSIVIVASVGVAATTSLIGYRLGWPPWVRPVVASALGLVMAQALARGMTRPLRELAAASEAMAAGDYSRRVDTPAVDEVGQLARAFNAMAAELAETDRQRRDLVANVSHELRTPLGGLQATLENLLDGVTPPDPAVFAAMAQQTQRLHRLVADLLDLSRLESGASALRIERVAVADLVDSAVAECRGHHDTVVVHAAVDPADLSLDADPERLHQVLANLLDNAARHAREQLTIAATQRSGPHGRSIVVTVTDDGPGIDPASRERVFERFYRADRARRDDGGAGLGLAIARWIVELHGGTIRCDEAVGGGATFVVELPAVPSAAAVDRKERR